MTRNQVKWAKKHDWFRTSVFTKDEGYAVIVECDVVGPDSSVTIETQAFTKFSELCTWAGY